MKFADFHVHSDYSDGRLPLEKVFHNALAAGLSMISITDHDSMNAYPSAIELGGKHGIQVVPGIEMTVVEAGAELHVLGYGCDPNHSLIKRHFELSRHEREERVRFIVERLEQEEGIMLDFQAMKSRYRFLERSALVMETADVTSMSPGYVVEKYFRPGKKFHIVPYQIGGNAPSAEQAVDAIRSSGGLVVLAHPFDPHLPPMSKDEVESLLASLFDGVEARHSRLSDLETDWLMETSEKLGLFYTAGSDCHGIDKGEGFKIGKTRISSMENGYKKLEAHAVHV